ncbi:MAG: hypothetical protein FJ088_13850, partial [Deltaproteobacteria bacterium]|nr:hypothetical protein [Deltaproteobacteria bacterium]
MKTRNSIYVLSMLLLALSYCAPVAVKKEVLSEKVISEKVEKGKSKHLINVENVAFSSADRFSADMVAK